MSLVSYDYSDSEDENLNNQEDQNESKLDNQTDHGASPSPQNDEHDSTNQPESNIFTKDAIVEEEDGELEKTNSFNLPQPKVSNVNNLLLGLGNGLKSSIQVQKQNNKVRILFSSLKNQIEEEEELNDDQDMSAEKKRPLNSSTGCGLLTMLPPPKKKKISMESTPSTLFKPNSLKTASSSAATKAPLFKPKSVEKTCINDQKEDDSLPSFFSFEDDHPSVNIPSVTVSNNLVTQPAPISTKHQLNFNIHPSMVSNQDEEVSNQEENAETEQVYRKLDEKSRLKHLIESKFGDKVDDSLNVIDVDMSKHINHNIDYIKSISEENEQVAAGPMPGGKAKRKHQITYLAYQAKQNEIKLKNEWAKNRNTKSQAKSRYGF